MPYTNTKSRRATKRAEAEERQLIYDFLSITERLELLDSRRGNSARERTRLESQTFSKSRKNKK